ncbi:LysR family transcriptional regulator [Rhodococcus sp. H29-C3]|uniref:LysR family transcriptional regulator n=1 Tax=Rhodococcus sp. H29-C3 TaxID=3046307 RepID=UPI0024B9B7FA|nr:LysR family transcriptional regulator [Rhodococcus sp. H29-C3]MDJ0362503.1 LysR family transcriptional regulator [Rhodococcus sp. H29-C3]
MDELATLRALQAVKDHGTVTAAAAVLRLSPSAVSQQLKRLERATGRSLLVPSGRRVTLTPEAHTLLDQAGPVVARLDELLGIPERVDNAVAGHVRIASFTTAIRHGALPAIAAVQQRHDRLTCSLTEMDPTESHHALAAGSVDIAIVHHWRGQPEPVMPSINAVHIIDDIADVICHRDLPLGNSPSLADLAGHDWVSTGAGSLCHSWLTYMFATHGFRPRIAMEISEFSLHVEFAAAGLGLALVPRLGRPPLPERARAIRLDSPPSRRVAIATRSRQSTDHAISIVARALGEYLTAATPSGAVHSR